MKPKLLNQITPTSAANDEVVVFDGDSGYKIKKSNILLSQIAEAFQGTIFTKICRLFLHCQQKPTLFYRDYLVSCALNRRNKHIVSALYGKINHS